MPEQAVATPASAMGTPAQGMAGGISGGVAAADLSGFGDAEDLLRSSGTGGRRNVFGGGSGYDMY